jgi:murein peptide amidase A
MRSASPDVTAWPSTRIDRPRTSTAEWLKRAIRSKEFLRIGRVDEFEPHRRGSRRRSAVVDDGYADRGGGENDDEQALSPPPVGRSLHRGTDTRTGSAEIPTFAAARPSLGLGASQGGPPHPDVRTRGVRRSLAVAVAIVVVALAGPAAVARGGVPVRLQLGRSEDGRPIVALRAGDPRGLRVLVVGCIHGTECAAIPVARALERVHARVDLWIVPNLNPDGYARGTRQNGRGVDLNANWSSGWRGGGRPWDVYYPGPRPFSERETRIARNLILRIRPRVTIWFHQHLNLVWAFGPSSSAGRVYARAAGMRFYHRPWLHGTATNWQNHHLPGSASLTVELPAGSLSANQVSRHVRAVLALAATLRRPTRAPAPSEPSILAAARRYARLGFPIYCGAGQHRAVSITIDDGPSPRTPALLRLLAAADAPATFFEIGRNAAQWPQLARAEAAAGAVGDHTWSHARLTKLAVAAIRSEFADARVAITRATSTRVLLFRPPYDAGDPRVNRIARQAGLLQVLWSADSRDWQDGRLSAIERNLRRALRPGAIILFHEQGRRTLPALRRLLGELRKRKLRPVTVLDLLAIDGPGPAPLSRDARARSCVEQ